MKKVCARNGNNEIEEARVLVFKPVNLMSEVQTCMTPAAQISMTSRPWRLRRRLESHRTVRSIPGEQVDINHRISDTFKYKIFY